MPSTPTTEAALTADHLTAHGGMPDVTGREHDRRPPSHGRLTLTAIAAFAVAVMITVLVLRAQQPAIPHAHLVPPVIVPGAR